MLALFLLGLATLAIISLAVWVTAKVGDKAIMAAHQLRMKELTNPCGLKVFKQGQGWVLADNTF